MPIFYRCYDCQARIESGKRCDKCQQKLRPRQSTEAQKQQLRFKDSAAWKECARVIRRRDQFTCQRCILFDVLKVSKVTGGCTDNREFPVDHKATRAERPDLAFDHENLWTLCPKCHGRKSRRELDGYCISWKVSRRIMVVTSPRLFIPERYKGWTVVKQVSRLWINRVREDLEKQYILFTTDTYRGHRTAEALHGDWIHFYEDDF